MNENYSVNEVIIVINPFANFNVYTVDDFSNVNCIALKELTYQIEADALCRIIKLTIASDSKENIINAIDTLSQRGDIYSAEPNYFTRTEYISRDPYYLNSEQWGINNISLPQAWSLLDGSESTVRVGVVDSGIDVSHPDLSAVVNQTLSRCFTDSFSTGLADNTGHGTHVAGIIGAEISTIVDDEKIGVAGVCPKVELVSLRVLNDENDVEQDALIEAINYAQYIDLPIINCSISGSVTNETLEDSEALRVAIQNYDGLFVCSAGNLARDINVYKQYPSNNNNLSNVISVGASNVYEMPASFSNFGFALVDIFASGESILSTYPQGLCSQHASVSDHYSNGYHSFSGTSMATPYVAGVAALMLSVNPSLQAYQIKNILLRNVDVSAIFSDQCVSGGILNAYKSVLAAQNINDSLTSYLSVSEQLHSVSYNVCPPECIDCDVNNHENCSGCEDCGGQCWVTVTEQHNFMIIDFDDNGHILQCENCDQIVNNTYNLYVGSELTYSIVIECIDCPFQLSCNSQQYTTASVTTHQVSYGTNKSFNESHHFTCVPDDNTRHKATCVHCGYMRFETHYLQAYDENNNYCAYCLMIVPIT